VTGEARDEVTDLLRAGIPITAAAGMQVIEAGPGRVELWAPFDPNRNYHGTVFGGSLAVIGILTGFLVVDSGLRRDGFDLGVVIQSSHMQYRSPVIDAFRSVSTEPATWPRFVETIRRHGRARVEVTSGLECRGEVVCSHVGVYAALRR
jgi:thioesterase domain-containing protein